MYLSNLEIIGFKSFAQRVNLKYDAGVTAIVGPNGCGKTNIVDAIRWALGEQRYSTLRSDTMEDVIFNGTKSRKPLGLAEVSLTIQNTKGILPTEYSEVTITRRVFRSGESEYLLNKVPCRLKDILDLFMDTGMGADAYSVIELKMVETILSDKTDERRRLFEEAAGVTKYKFRRKAAIRKLESVQQDLVRVNDIVKEVQKTVNSLERQAKKAEQYNDVSQRLKTLQVDLLEREYAYFHTRLQPLEQKYGLAASDKTKIDETLQLEEDQLDRLRSALNETERELAEANTILEKERDALHFHENQILIAKERRASLQNNHERYEQEKTALFAQKDKLEQERAALRAREEQLGREVQESQAVYEQSKQHYLVAAKQVETTRARVQSLNDALLGLAHATVEKRGEQERLKARIDNLKGRIERSAEEIQLYESDIQKNEELVAQLTNEDRELRRRFVESEMQMFEQENSKKQLKEEIDRLQKRMLETKNEIQRRKEKADFLRGLIVSNEGFSEAAKYLLSSENWKKKKLAAVADVVKVPEPYRIAVESALGETASFLIVLREEDASAAIEELRKQDKGKATFICLQRIPKVRRSSKRTRGLTWATSVVETPPPYRNLVEFLLKDIVLVKTLQEAESVLRSMTQVCCVTENGQMVTSAGLLRGGGQRPDEAGWIGKEDQIATIQQEIDRLNNEHNILHTQVTAAVQAYDARDMQPYIGAVKAIEKEMTAIEMRIAQVVFEKKRAQDGIERNRQEQGLLEHEIDGLQHGHAALVLELHELEQRKSDSDAQSAVAAHELETAELRLTEETKVVNELEIKVVRLQSDARNTGRDIERAVATQSDIQTTLARRDEEIAWAKEEISRLSVDVETQTKELGDLENEFETQEQRKQEIENGYTTKRNELHRIELKIKDERRMHDSSLSAVHDLELKISELKSNMEHLKQRASEEFKIDLQLKTYAEDEWVDFAQLRDQVKTLEERIRTLGAINFAAFDEFKTESERYTFLTQQRDDLIEAEKTLLDTIEEINNTAQRKFLETFTKIRENFIKTFKELFQEGDECDLKLEEGVDPLEANIEIIAKPRGKRPTSIDLLSGGEKTLTAIALLFAIYLVKPSPFCILDEVDAPLDDSNIDRFTRILKKFSNNTQFIVVTHNKRTMESAQALYGVTMEEEGVSKIVTVRFNEEARVQSATVTTGL